MTKIIECEHCGGELEDNAMCDCLEYARPVQSSAHSFTVSCNECGYAGSIERVQLHSCQIQQQGGRCEDYPCCGHTDGDGCQHLPEHTSEYWMNVMQSMPNGLYEELDASGYWDR